jgi:hypothetical protein
LPPIAVAEFDGSLDVAVAVAEPPAPPGFPGAPVAPIAPVTVTVPASTDIAPAASNPSGSAVVTNSRFKKATPINPIAPSRIAPAEAAAR